MDTPAEKKRSAGSSLRRWLRIAFRVVLILILIPVVLVPVYLVVPPVSTLMVGTAIVRLGDISRDWVSFDEIGKTAVVSVVMSEDGQFCEHAGVDWSELTKVLDRKGEPSRGASTIPMQTVKNLFLWTSRSYVRKALEIPLALYADFVWPKRRMIEIYMNIAEWGPGIFGIEAAAQYYFKKHSKDLTASQAALLAVTLPDPSGRNPAKPTRFMQSLARTVAARARASGAYIGCLYP